MKYTFLLLFIFILENNAISQNVNKVNQAQEIIRLFFEDEGAQGLAVTVSIKDSVVWSEGMGFRDIAKTLPIDPTNTQFRIASLSKPITTTILGSLYEKKMIRLDESVYTYVPTFPRKKYDFTIRQLALHQSGIRHYRAFARENKKPLSIREGLSKFQKSKLKFEPGTKYLYSSYGYNLLGVAMENASFQSFEELMKSEVTNELGMYNTIPDRGSYEGMNISGFFEVNKRKKVKVAEDVNMFMKLPSGGMLSTSEDLVKFGTAYIYGRILSDSTRAEMLTRPLINGKEHSYALGWGVSKDKKGRTYYSHTGGNTGSVCRIIIYPEEELCIAIVINTFGVDYLRFIKDMRNATYLLLGDQLIEQQKAK